MSVWKEIRCDSVPIGKDCWASQNNTPQGFQSVGDLKKEARAEGWKFTRDGDAFCPACKNIKQETSDD